MTTDIGLIDLTLSPTDAVARPGHEHIVRGTVIESEIYTSSRMQRISNLRFSPHALTHIDLPNSVGLPNPTGDEPEIPGTTAPLWCEAIVVNLRDRRETLAKFLGIEDALPWPLSYVDIYQVRDLLSNPAAREELARMLLVSTELLESVAKKHGGLRGKLLLFDTGWNWFIPRNTNLGHPYWMGLHPYLLAPYLDKNGAMFLKEAKAMGVGTDSSTVECLHWKWASNPLTRGWSVLAAKAGGYGPIHRYLLSAPGRLMVLESLSVPIEIYGGRTGDSILGKLLKSKVGWEAPQTITGDVLVLPFVMTPQDQAVVVKVYFEPSVHQPRGE